MTKERLLEKLSAEVERWNRDNPVGCTVRCGHEWFGSTGWASGLGGGGGIRNTTSAAFLHEQHPSIFVTGISMPVPLDWCTPC